MIFILFFAFLAGIATVLSPCILPVLPAILSVSTRRPLPVILGLLASFTFFTLALTSIVHLFGVSATLLRLFAIFIIGFFGIVMLIPFLSNKFAQKTSFIADAGTKLQGSSGFLVGVALGLVWTPCAGPILAAITTLVATQKITWMVVFMTIAYAIGAGIPLLMIAYGGKKLLHIPILARHTETIRQVFGILMILTAVALYFNWETKFSKAVIDYLPEFNIEKHLDIQKHLQALRSKSHKTPDQSPLTGGNSPSSAEEGAPLAGITGWINTNPLTLNDLKGKVVLVDFWTYSCINCIRTLPYLEKWYDKYKDKGLVILGIHTPEFEFEKEYGNVKNATEELGVKYPVLMDNNYAVWTSFDNLYWPAHYLIDQNGNVVDSHFGEGGYLETENKIRQLLGLAPLENVEEKPIMMAIQTPETYLGYARGTAYFQDIAPNKSKDYTFDQTVGSDQVALSGLWTAGSESITSGSDQSELYLNFKANRVYLVLGGNSQKPIKVYLDQKESGEVFVTEPKKYDMVHLHGEGGRHLLKLVVPRGIQVYAFTFGMEE